MRHLLLELHRAPVDQLRLAGRYPDTDQAVLESLPVLNFATRVTLSQEELQCYGTVGSEYSNVNFFVQMVRMHSSSLLCMPG